MINIRRELIISDPLTSTLFMIKHAKEIADKEGNVIIIDNKGIISSKLEFDRINLNKLNLFNSYNYDVRRIIDCFSASLNLDDEERSIMLYSLYNLKEKNITIGKLIEKIASMISAMIASASHLIKLEKVLAKLYEINEIDDILSSSSNLDLIEELDSKNNLILNISSIKNNKARIFFTLVILDWIINENKSNMMVFVDNVEGRSMIGLDKEIICRLLDELTFKGLSYCFSCCLEDIKNDIYSRFTKIYYISHNNYMCIKNCFIDDSTFNLITIENNKISRKDKFKYEDFDFNIENINKDSSKIKQYKSLLEISYGNLAELISDLIIELQKNIVRRSEIKHVMNALGYFVEDWDNLIDNLIKDGLIEEKMFSGVKKVLPTYKGIFMANEHKKLK